MSVFRDSSDSLVGVAAKSIKNAIKGKVSKGDKDDEKEKRNTATRMLEDPNYIPSYSRSGALRFIDLLVEPEFTVLRALVECLDLSDTDKVSDQVSVTLLIFLEKQQIALPFLLMMISREIRCSEQANTLFRRNSIASKMLSKYTKDKGSVYLEKVLSGLIEKISTLKVEDVELNPQKPHGDLQKASKMLHQLCEECLIESVNAMEYCPDEFRQLCHHLRKGVEEQFGKKMGRSAVGGYIFLRYICPAMVSPSSFGLGNVKPNSKKILMKISKVIQTLSNGITTFKEDYMKPVEIFLQQNEGTFQQFLDDLATVPETFVMNTQPKVQDKTGHLDDTTVRALFEIHMHLKRNIHVIGSVVAAMDTEDGVAALKTTVEKSGWLSKTGGSSKGWKRRWFVLQGHQMFYFKNQQSTMPAGRIPLGSCTVVKDGDLQFNIVTQYRTYEIQAESVPEMQDWIRAIKATLKSVVGTTSSGQDSLISRGRSTSKAKTTISEDIRGWIKKAGPKGGNWKKRWFILNANMFLYFKSPDSSAPLGQIRIDDAKIKDMNESRFDIETGAGRVFYLDASSARDKQNWLKSLNEAAEKYRKEGRNEAEMAHSIDLANSANLEAIPVEKEGFLLKQGGALKQWNKRWFVLRGQELHYYKSSAAKDPVGAILLTHAKITAATNGKNSFEVLTRDRNFFLKATSGTDMRSWVDALKLHSVVYSDIELPKDVAITEADIERAFEDGPQTTQVLCQGWLQKQGGSAKGWRMRWCVLQNNHLSYYKSMEDREPAGMIPIAGAKCGLAEEKLGKKFAFEISTRYRTYFMLAKDEYEMAKWMRHIDTTATRSSSSASMERFFELNVILSEWDEQAQ